MCKQLSIQTESENKRWERRCLRNLRQMSQRQQSLSFKKIKIYFQYPTLPRNWNETQAF